MAKYLFIDDSGAFLDAVGLFFRNNPDVVFAPCQSVEEAMKAIEANGPTVIFLDHSLTQGGNEGFEIMAKLQQQGSTATIYSTTDNAGGAAPKYVAMGIQVLGKSGIGRYKAIIG